VEDVLVRKLHPSEGESPPGSELPAVIEALQERTPEFLAQWISHHREWVETRLLADGGILFRGFGVRTPEQLEMVALTIAPDLRSEYGLGDSPRIRQTERVFSATEFPSWFVIPLHNELNYMADPAHTIMFCCQKPPVRDGETPICDFRKVLKALNPAVRDRFTRKGVRYRRRFKNWRRELAATSKDAAVSREAAEDLCRKRGCEFEWLPNGSLQLTTAYPAVCIHPQTRDLVWFNQAQSYLGAAVEHRRFATRAWAARRRFEAFAYWIIWLVLKVFEPSRWIKKYNYPTFGDGSKISTVDIRHICDVTARNTVYFRWQEGDLLVLDNILTAHGRMPYKGSRSVFTCFA
jgi:alpha-ketoglutarate-dependent taurine dioxygenase